MLTKKEYLKRLKRKSYEELLEEREKLLLSIAHYEQGIPKDNEIWNQDPDPDVIYYHNLQYLSEVYQLLSEKFLKRLNQQILEESRSHKY